jgi:Ca2+-binding RTX toxin-like protein
MRYLLVFSLLFGGVASASHSNQCAGLEVNDPRATEDSDFLTGSDTRDVISLGDGADQYFAAEGDDTLCGNVGNDLLVGEGGDDVLNGGEGPDHLVGFGGADLLSGGFGADELEGDGGADVIRSQAEDETQDVLRDGPGQDTIFGNAEDVWFRCNDEVPDDHEGFRGEIRPDPSC